MYSDSEEEDVGHVEWILQQLLEAELNLKPEKCQFNKEIVRNLGLIISPKGISMDEDKIRTIRNWSWEKKTKNGWLNNLFKVQQFLGFCNHSRRFIPKYSKKAKQLTRLTKKNEQFICELVQQLAFQTMVTAFTEAPAFPHFNHAREVIIETNVSNDVSA